MTTYLLERKRFAIGESLFDSFATQWFDSGLHFPSYPMCNTKIQTYAQKASIIDYGVDSSLPTRATHPSGNQSHQVMWYIVVELQALARLHNTPRSLCVLPVGWVHGAKKVRKRMKFSKLSMWP